MKVAQAATIDVVCILLFAVVGRRSHAEASDLLGVLGTAWPFLAGCAIGFVVARAWRRPESLSTSVIVWISTVAAGMLLRLLSGDTAKLPFVIVATLVLGLLLVGWRAGYRAIQRARIRHTSRASAP
ncbi:DUF3054 domain-containing protein [Microlunatus panaciterrae]|uniref:Peptidoglycan/LPS O-acetylase OafA/YrhL n=1 Tax=Microlunatus panaciterrae TaxID=400768 RepID=A0ABS2RE66_9ACTN|nr:DUF3054 domain-containing protein [Microlunatus panaciterrae]MBM7797237.1 peptidoglycan/LPS O-acetylase OafA/YrhL [Microlunatus panaciterrae]